MKFFLILFFLFLFQNCSKPKTVSICGDHVCVNKAEAKQYFEENLSIEIKVVDKKENREINLVELNLINNSENNKKINIIQKEKTFKEIKVLSNDEIKNIKDKIKKVNKSNKIASKKINKAKSRKKMKINEKKNSQQKDTRTLTNEVKKISKKNVNKTNKEVVDICTIIKKCSIDEISKYILMQDKKKGFPDITIRE
jgi:hypothetical protein